ncbi:transmembrane channel-like protein 7 isoform X2 [Argiope bruennichi]|uniref:transmembrane channel-like protein 7 isoform X2 n=1 Tax=Argiope bruennichi TaxID=94029 RepID=UPI0024950809|nr:transmembrane channel-like protein 7 isoform X2 [Argiope bruennichi]XP_055936167.1 transmembrane channel-like protein 7 isoform X2 [Argiope bruennichi]
MDGGHSSNEESQFIDPESLFVESQINKKPKKISNVRFAPEATAINTSICSEDGGDFSEPLSENEIKTEICSYLPSNTLGRRRLQTLNKYHAAKSLTLPHRSSKTDNDIPLSRLRHRSFAAPNKPNFLATLGRHATPKQSFTFEDIQDSTDDFKDFFTEEEKKKELSNIRNIPIRLSQRKLYREAILDTLPLGRPKDKSCWSKCLDLLGCFKHASAALELWNDSLKRIEGLQGTGVVSYFVFLRWLIALNLILFILYFLLVTLPHAAFYVLPLKDISIAPNESVITEEFLNKYDKPRPTEFKPKETKNSSLRLHSDDLFSNWGILLDNLPDNILDITLAYDKRNYTSAERRNFSEYCEARYRTEMENNTGGILSAMQDLLQGTGWLQSTILFLGYYPANEISYFGLVYNMPVAVIAVLFVSFVICLCMMIQYSSHGVHETILARKNDYLQYSNILFCSWDYCIEDRKSSVIRHNSILHEIKSTLAEERRKREIKEWSRGKKIKVYFLRTFINLFVIAALCSSYYLIYRVVNYQLEEMQLHRLNKPGVNTLFIQYLSPIVITGLNIFVPIIFNNIVRFEMYNTQTQINMALFRTVFLRLSSVFVLVGLLYQQITCEPRDMCGAGMSETCRSPICWETYVGQQLYKLAVTDFFVYVMMFILYDVPRDVIVRHFKNKVTQMVGRQVFDLPNQVLALVYSQTLCWLGVVYSPLLPAITVIKFIAIFYIKKQMVLKYCVPAPIPYKASRSNAMFMIILMLSFFTLMIIHGYSLSKVEPSPACSPFRHYFVMTEALSDTVLKRSTTFASIFNFFFSALFLIPAIILMCIAIYYYWTIVVAHRKMVKVLKAQIAIEGHDKQFLLNRLTEVAKGQFYK